MFPWLKRFFFRSDLPKDLEAGKSAAGSGSLPCPKDPNVHSCQAGGSFRSFDSIRSMEKKHKQERETAKLKVSYGIHMVHGSTDNSTSCA